MPDGNPVDYDPFNSYPVDYDPWSGQSPYQKLKGYAANLPSVPQHDMTPGSPYRWWDATKQHFGNMASGMYHAFADPLDPEHLTPERAFNVASLATGGGLGRAALGGTVGRAAGADALGTFGGQTMLSWGKGSELFANALEKSGAAPREIYNKTGLWKGPEGLWRDEIIDQGAKLTPNAVALMNRPSGARQSEVMTHPSLYAEYPKMADERIVGNPNLRSWGTKHPDYTSIRSTIAPEDITNVLLHEGQHGIQDVEGFAQGYTTNEGAVRYDDPETWKNVQALEKETGDIAEKYIRSYDHTIPGQSRPIWKSNTPDSIIDRHKYLQGLVQDYWKTIPDLAKTRYKYAYGETEASNVEARYSPGKLPILSPLQTEQRLRQARGIGLTDYLVTPYTPPGYMRGPGGYGPMRPIPIDQLLSEPGALGGPGYGGRFHPTGGSTDKAITANTKRDEKIPSAATHPPDPEVVAAVQHIAGILAKPQINAKYDIPYGWGSNKEGGLTYRDKSIPELIPIKGKKTNVDKYLHIHEQIERILMILLKYPYEHAHKIATSFERAAVEADKIDWIAYETEINKLLEVTEKEKGDKLPPDLFTMAYSKSDLKKFQGGKSGSQ